MLIFGYDPSRSGGVFTMQRTGVNDAEFMFYGWNSLVGRSTPQLIEVKRGNHSDIRAAIASKMASLIRESVREDDFLWDSRRLRRVMTLSARIKDNAELEAFLRLEFEYL